MTILFIAVIFLLLPFYITKKLKYQNAVQQIREIETHYDLEKERLTAAQSRVSFLEEEITVIRASYIREIEAKALFQERAQQLLKMEEALEEKNSQYLELLGEKSRLEKELIAIEVALAQEKSRFEEKIGLIQQSQEEVQKMFQSTSFEMLKHVQETFLSSAKQTFEKYQTSFQGDLGECRTSFKEAMTPLKDALHKVTTHVDELEKARIGAYAGITEHLKNLLVANETLNVQTTNLSKALRNPNFRGKWGEIQLRRVVELAGMVEHCDFLQQEQYIREETVYRPDLVVTLPNNRKVIIDAKAPLQEYLDGVESETDADKKAHFALLAKNIRKHLLLLSEKAYWKVDNGSAEFVVLFLPGEAFFSAALSEDPSLIEYGISKKVLLSTPTTLIALLKAVAYSWQEHSVAEHAEAIIELGRTLYERLKTMTEHITKLKRALDSTVGAYNKFAASYEGRVLTSARRFEQLSFTQNSIDSVEQVELSTRQLATEEN